MTTKFDVYQDNELVTTGTHFYCQGHLAAVPVAEQSPDDNRFCRSCYDFLARDAEVSGNSLAATLAAYPVLSTTKNAQQPCDKTQRVSTDVPEVLSHPSVNHTGGRAAKQLPLRFIEQLLNDGFSGRQITERVNAQGIEVSARTIQRTIKQLEVKVA